MSQLVNMRGAGVPPEQANPPAAAATPAATVPPPWTPEGGSAPNIPLGMSADDLASVQRKLGLMPTRVIDGRTTDAIRAYQIQHGLPSTGTLDLALAKRILAG
jgi:peptidoglycan hydrolase-like protein with peptidoglycan-binding domain